MDWIIECERPATDEPWRVALLPLAAVEGADTQARGVEQFHIDGLAVRCMRTFHEEVAADFFFASHYNCDPGASLEVLAEAAGGREQRLVWWHHAERILEEAPDDFVAILRMFRAAMATLHPQGIYLRMLFPTAAPTILGAALRQALGGDEQLAGVGFDYESGESHFDPLVETLVRPRPLRPR